MTSQYSISMAWVFYDQLCDKIIKHECDCDNKNWTDCDRSKFSPDRSNNVPGRAQHVPDRAKHVPDEPEP